MHDVVLSCPPADRLQSVHIFTVNSEVSTRRDSSPLHAKLPPLFKSLVMLSLCQVNNESRVKSYISGDGHVSTERKITSY